LIAATSFTGSVHLIVNPFNGSPRPVTGMATLRPLQETLLNTANDTVRLTATAAAATSDIPLLDWWGMAILLTALATVAAICLR
jgi:hypothetical protein